MPKEGALTRSHKLKWVDIRARVRDNLTAIASEDKRDSHILTNMNRPPAEGNFCDKQGKSQIPVLVSD
jgi:hypothetical protein